MKMVVTYQPHCFARRTLEIYWPDAEVVFRDDLGSPTTGGKIAFCPGTVPGEPLVLPWTTGDVETMGTVTGVVYGPA